MKRMSGHEQFQLSLFWLETEGPSRVLRGLFLFLLSPTSCAREGCTWCSGEPSHQVAGSKHPVSVFAGEGLSRFISFPLLIWEKCGSLSLLFFFFPYQFCQCLVLSLVLSSPIQLCSISLWVRAFIGICTAQLYVLSKRYLHSYVLGRLQQPAASARSDQSCSCPSSSQQSRFQICCSEYDFKSLNRFAAANMV